MPKYYTSLSPDLAQWALTQPLFFVASAPLAGCHINVSPKGLPSASFAILNPNQCAYIDCTGSGCETISHVYENGRVTVMFISFEQNPRIMRLFCSGEVLEMGTPAFENMVRKMDMEGNIVGARAVIVLNIWKVQTACGFGVPLLNDAGVTEGQSLPPDQQFKDRRTLGDWATMMTKKEALDNYRNLNNHKSLDGLNGLKCVRKAQGENIFIEDVMARMKVVSAQKEAMLAGACLGFVLLAFLRFLVKCLA